MTANSALGGDRLRVGVDLGGTYTKVVVMRGEEIIDQETTPTTRSTPSDTVAQLCRVVSQAVGRCDDTASIGLTVPGHCDNDGRALVIPNLPGDWPGTPVKAPVESAAGRPVALINDARAFGAAEAALGAARSASTAIGLALGTGIGGVVILGGVVHDGAAGQAGEIGHQVLQADGPPCGCGNRGCLEALARADVVAASAGQPSMLEAVSVAEHGDPAALAAVDTAMDWVGQGLANLVTVLQPEVVFLGGGVAQAGSFLLEKIRHAIAYRSPLVPASSYRVVSAALGARAGAVGAALAGGRVAG